MTASGIAAPLSGTTVLVTRPRDSGSPLPSVLRRAGADVVWQPAIRIDQTLPTPELDEALRGLEGFEWVAFTSVHGVAAFWRRASALGIEIEKTASTKFAAVGPLTARAIERHGVDVAVTAYPYSAEGFVVQMAYWLKAGSTVLYPRAAGARAILVEGLRRLGACVTEVRSYRTVPDSSLTELSTALECGVDCIVFCSPSAVQAMLPHHALIERSAIACIGPTTANAARAAGLRVQIVPPRATAFALAEAVIEHFHPGAAAAP